MSPTRLVPLSLAVLVASLASARAERSADNFFRELLEEVRAALEDASIERAPKPPQPVAYQWRTTNRGSVSSGAALLALEAANMDGKLGDELVALTTAELLIVGLKPKPQIVARAPLPTAAAIIRSRDPVGAISLERGPNGTVVAVRTSEQMLGGRYELRDGALTQVETIPAEAGFPLCTGISAQLELGKNGFDPATLTMTGDGWPAGLAKPSKPFYRLECRHVIGVDGRRNRIFAYSGIERRLVVGCSRATSVCPNDAVSSADISGAGVAFEVADINRDGMAELSSSLGKAPKAGDRIRVHGRSAKLLRSKNLTDGIVAISAVDVLGDGRRQLYFAVRGSVPSEITLWTLNRHP